MRKKSLITVALITLGLFISTIPLIAHADDVNNTSQSSRVASYDISQWQGPVNDDQARGLKSEVNFMILKAENGSRYKDPQFTNTSRELTDNHIPYGAYDYSVYSNPMQAIGEAYLLRKRAPKAKFYVNDCEQNDAGNKLDVATQTWADEMHRLTSKPVVLYSDLAFLSNLSQSTRDRYDALWVADYNNEPDPAWHYDLWQFTDQHYSPALNQEVDASIVPYGGRSITFWMGRNRSHSEAKPKRRHVIRPRRRKATRTRVKHINFAYYQSHHVRHLLVIHRSGINLYYLNGKYFRHVRRGTVLHVRYFRRYPFTKYTYMTRAVDYSHHRWFMYTARKSKSTPYYYK